ncbi:maestro heat-like repeat-containing protein family member 1 [Mauremys reevesii]|uniref:maestro heat-like repeat-containing protein family member 1 n=1 Tax=Mauremys reevesii TaxID=260615 RepID=UPI00193EFC90|nr:maestro heat-like repeat-containing protein family member 1 [Mauremys reevesii]
MRMMPCNETLKKLNLFSMYKRRMRGKQLPSRPEGGSSQPSGEQTQLPAQAPSPGAGVGGAGRSLANRFSLAIPHSWWVQDEGQQLRFLQAIYPSCLAAQDRGQDTLEPRCCKAAVVERIVELIEELPKDSSPSAILTNSLVAVGNLSTMKPALEPDLETHLLQAALRSVFTLGTEKDTINIQALHKVMPELLDAMLGNLLAESPDADRLRYILEHVNLWIVSRVSQERARAIRSSMALLRFAVTLPEFDISAEFPRMGHHVAQLALFVSDPDKDISRQAREGTYRLYQLLLQQRGLTIHEAEDLWCHDWHQDSRLLGYKNTARVGEVFGKFFSEGQRKYFLQIAMLAIHNRLLRVSQAGLLLTYSILGEAQQLLGDELEDVTAKVMCQLRIIRHLHQVPEALQGLRLI